MCTSAALFEKSSVKVTGAGCLVTRGLVDVTGLMM